VAVNVQKNISRLSLFLALVFWVVDAFVDSLFSRGTTTFIESCFYPSGEELWMRSFVVLLFMVFAAYTERLLKIINNMTRELKQYHDRLEYTVNELQMEMEERKLAIEELEQLAITDPLTSLFNRRKFNELLDYEIERNQRYNTGLSLIMCDIDHFKQINDKFGHIAGDTALKTFSTKVTENIRDVDIFARWGGEEFMILMPNANIDSACSVAEKLRRTIEETDIKTIESLTASFGVTNCNIEDTTESLLNRVDEALYKAKQLGRNTVVTAN
jgi:diguanylate cyclase (GGDEF)-like protein